ncbi:ribonuclease E/G [Thalassobacillus pellis]|uniref:ribonuclease E/G n=1 Tax=Thalassobacillus pellis TaxID=748008 RepID=UPI001960CDA1|nr:ribonuclease E/G [Thalassobacillus pellis]MBM7554624.1 ribonuclease G [Thalassobacillus pellis]
MKRLYISVQSTERAALLEENNQSTEVYFDRLGKKARVGDIYYGKVEKVDKGLQAAFIDFGDEKNGFLRKQEISHGQAGIESLITEGEKRLFQIKKENFGNKGAVLTTEISIAGSYLVYLPYKKQVSVSKKLPLSLQEEWKVELEEFLEKNEGVIVRTAAAEQPFDVLLNELNALRKQWFQAVEESENKKPHSVYRNKLVPDEVMRKNLINELDQVIVDDVSLANSLRERFPASKKKIRWERDWDATNRIAALQERLIQPVVPASRGTELHISETEAMVVIDINSKGYSGKMNKQQTALQVNLAVVPEVVRQIRLRNLSGIIMIDFITMHSSQMENKVFQALKHELAKERIQTQIYGFTKLGILEMTRKRERPSWQSFLQADHPASFTLETKVMRLERELLKYKHTNHEAVLVGVSNEFAAAVKRLISDRISSKISQVLFFHNHSLCDDYFIELAGSREMVEEFVASRGYHIDNTF